MVKANIAASTKNRDAIWRYPRRLWLTSLL